MTEDLIRQRFDEARHRGLNIAVCRISGSSDVYFFLSAEKPQLRRLETKAISKPLFLFSPYGAGNMAYFFNASAIYRNEQLIVEEPAATASKKEEAYSTGANFASSREQYISYVEQAVSEIKADKLDKLVAARCRQVKAPDDHAALFAKLLEAYPSATVHYFNIHGVGTWIGATPEKLVSLHQESLTTVALAGTLPPDSGDEWGQKEKDEHAMVTDFIEQVLEKHKLSFKRSDPATVNAGKLKHLQCSFEAKISPEEQQARFHKILADLNPTPAVCGIPQFDASVFIGLHEKMERRFYSGFIGMATDPSNIDLYVNLRCMQVDGDTALLYAGAGITEHSDAAKEWEETERKMQVLETFLQ